MSNSVHVNGALTCLDDEERIKRLLEQATEETDKEYQQRLLERATGTKDKPLQAQRHEILVLMQTLKTSLATLDKERDERFIEEVSKDLMELNDSLPGYEPDLRFTSHGNYLTRRGSSF
jgi:predicted FMN-binding regulatory protein PaiB